MTENFENMMEEALSQVQEVKVGDVVKGEVLVLEDRQALVSILGTGVEGVVPVKELTADPDAEISDLLKVGDVLDLVVITTIGKDKENGSYLLSKRRLEAKKIWVDVEEAFKNNQMVEGKVVSAVRGGLVVDLGIRGFVPASMVEARFVSDFSSYVGKTLQFKVVEIDIAENRLILSHKAVVEEQREVIKAEVLGRIHVGDVVEGKVARLTDFGAFVDLGGMDGLVHVSEISHVHVKKPSDVLEVGQTVNVKVLAINPESDRISLSIKATEPGPWDNIEERAAVGSVLKGTVKRLTTFGAFVELFPGVEGLVHISQISHEHIATPNDKLKVGEEIDVKVLDVRPAEHRIGLSIKALTEAPVVEKAAPKKAEAEYVMPEEETGYSMGDVLGDALKAAEAEKKDNDEK